MRLFDESQQTPVVGAGKIEQKSGAVVHYAISYQIPLFLSKQYQNKQFISVLVKEINLSKLNL